MYVGRTVMLLYDNVNNNVRQTQQSHKIYDAILFCASRFMLMHVNICVMYGYGSFPLRLSIWVGCNIIIHTITNSSVLY